ncbi:MAG: hypothetical protein ACOZEN_13970 [Thermodesulfobacteriota bacterium]|jgi:hypothetical protein
MMTITYLDKARPAPASCPCLTCGVYGPYCGDSCLELEAWFKAGKPGRTTAAFAAQEGEKPHE